MDNLKITQHAGDGGGEYHASFAGSDDTGRLTYKIREEGVRVADHTLVPPSMRGRGVAAQLVERLVADAREEGFKIVPQCSYVEAAFNRNDEWSDLRAS